MKPEGVGVTSAGALQASMPEMPNAGQDHDHFALVGGGYHFLIAH